MLVALYEWPKKKRMINYYFAQISKQHRVLM
jgi:hypothetical protein